MSWHPHKIIHETAWFWREALGVRGSALPLVLPSCLVFVSWACLVVLLHLRVTDVTTEIGPHEFAGVVLGLILVLRTNLGYDRWWEARKLWGAIVNQCRNLVVDAIAYGPADLAWRQALARTTAAFAHACRLSLRGQRDITALRPLLDEAAEAAVARADHMPAQISLQLARLLRQAADSGALDRFAFLQADRERAALLDHLGGCERILKTPMPRSYSLKIRGFILLYLGTLPFAVVDKLGLLTPLMVLLISYPVLALDQAGIELQNPFLTTKVNHLPLDDITTGLERNLLALVAQAAGPEVTERGHDAGEADDYLWGGSRIQER